MLEFAHRDQEGDFIKKQQKTFETHKTDLKKKTQKTNNKHLRFPGSLKVGLDSAKPLTGDVWSSVDFFFLKLMK